MVSEPDPRTTQPEQREPRVFRSVPVLVSAVVFSLILVAVWVGVYANFSEHVQSQFTVLQLATLAFFVVFMVGFMLAIGLSTIRVDGQGVHVRNLFRTRHHQYDQIDRVSFRTGDPWPYLVLRTDDPDDEQRQMMLGIQRVGGSDQARAKVADLRECIEAWSAPR